MNVGWRGRVWDGYRKGECCELLDAAHLAVDLSGERLGECIPKESGHVYRYSELSRHRDYCDSVESLIDLMG